MDRGSCTIADERSLVDCVNRTIAEVHGYAGLLTGGDRGRAEQLVLDVYSSVARHARLGPCVVPFGQLVVATRRQFVADLRALERGAVAVEWAEAVVVDDRGEAILVPEVQLDVSLLSRMPDLQRAVLVFHRVEGLTDPEIAAELGIGQRRVATLLRRALRRIGVRSVDAVQADVLGVAGPPLEPSPDLLSAARRLAVAEQRGEPVERVARRRRLAPTRRTWIGAAAAVVAVFTGVAWSGAVSVAREEEPPPLANTSRPMCPGHVTSQGLAEVGFAFDGTVEALFAGTDLAGGPVRAVTFDVHRWRRGEGDRRLTVRWRGSVRPHAGMRMLVSGGESGGVLTAWGCGYSVERTDVDAALWDAVLGPPDPPIVGRWART